MIEHLGSRFCRIAERWFPDPFVFAILLTFLTLLLAIFLTPAAPSAALDAWQGPAGFWSLLAFAMQMCLILVTGHALASTPLVSRAIRALAERPRSTGSAAALVAFVAIAAAYLNWGLGLIVGALLAREIGVAARRRGIALHYPLVVAAGYTGLMTWHGGLSGSAPLKSTRAADLLELLKDPALVARILDRPIAEIAQATPAQLAALPGLTLDRTLGSTLNLVVGSALLLFVPLFVFLLAPRRSEDCSAAPESLLAPEPAAGPPTDSGPGRRLDRSRLLAYATAALGFAWLFGFFRDGGLKRLDPNVMNLSLLFLGLALHGTPIAYVQAIERAARGCAGILLQFPFYAGIIGIMAGTGLLKVFADAANQIATPATLPVLTFLSACVINLFVPSGGGQWAVQGPIVMQAAVSLGASPEHVLMAVAYGDECTNMLQPFWALPLLGITGLRAGQVMGYTVLVMLLSLPLFVLPLLLL